MCLPLGIYILEEKDHESQNRGHFERKFESFAMLFLKVVPDIQ